MARPRQVPFRFAPPTGIATGPIESIFCGADANRLDVIVKTNLAGFRREARQLANRCRGTQRHHAVCEVLLHEGVETYKKEGPKFMQRLVARQKARVKRP